ALSTLPATPLSDGERAQAVWLVSHTPALVTADSAIAPYRPAAAAGDGSIGRLVITIDGRALEALIDPTRRGITVDPRASAAARARRFPARGDAAVPAVADTVRIGALTLANVPLRLEPLPDRVDAIVGIDLFQRFAATFDPPSGRVTLRAAGVIPATLAGIRVPTLTSASD